MYTPTALDRLLPPPDLPLRREALQSRSQEGTSQRFTGLARRADQGRSGLSWQPTATTPRTSPCEQHRGRRDRSSQAPGLGEPAKRQEGAFRRGLLACPYQPSTQWTNPSQIATIVTIPCD